MKTGNGCYLLNVAANVAAVKEICLCFEVLRALLVVSIFFTLILTGLVLR